VLKLTVHAIMAKNPMTCVRFFCAVTTLTRVCSCSNEYCSLGHHMRKHTLSTVELLQQTIFCLCFAIRDSAGISSIVSLAVGRRGKLIFLRRAQYFEDRSTVVWQSAVAQEVVLPIVRARDAE
jgi:hypothetical protein